MLSEKDQKIIKTLLLLGFVPHTVGYHYIFTAIQIASEDPTVLHRGVTYLLYPEVAKAYETSTASVERGIRSAIGKAWERGSKQHWNMIFPGLLKKAPTNAYFLSILVQWFQLDEADALD